MKKIIILVLIFSTLILGVSYLVIQPSLALDPLQKTNLSYLKYEEDDDFLYQRIYDFILENDDLLIGLSSYNMSNYLDENYDYMVKVAVNYVIDHKDDFDNIQNNMISLDEVYKSNARTGVSKELSYKILQDLGYKWIAKMKFGQGCKTHLKAGELPSKGTFIVSLSKHLTVIKDGVIHDIYDPSRNGTRCVYG